MQERITVQNMPISTRLLLHCGHILHNTSKVFQQPQTFLQHHRLAQITLDELSSHRSCKHSKEDLRHISTLDFIIKTFCHVNALKVKMRPLKKSWCWRASLDQVLEESRLESELKGSSWLWRNVLMLGLDDTSVLLPWSRCQTKQSLVVTGGIETSLRHS